MAKKVKRVLKLIIKGGQAQPAPPLGPQLSQVGVNIKDFCDQFNSKTQESNGLLTPVVLYIYEDQTFTFELKTPPAAELIRKILNLKKGSGVPNLDKVGKITRAQLEEIAQQKMPDLNTNDLEAAVKIIQGTAKQMGVEYEE